jgi:hypothetical protein
MPQREASGVTMAWITGIQRATNYKCPLQNAPGFSAANGLIVWLTRLWLLYHYPLIQGTAWRTSLAGPVSSNGILGGSRDHTFQADA